MGAYGSEAQMALEMIRESGGPVIVAHKKGDTIDPVTQVTIEGGERVWRTKGVTLPPQNTRDFPQGALLVRDIVEVWIAAKNAPYAPDLNDTIQVGKKVRTILKVWELAPDGVAILWKFYAEAGTSAAA